MMAIPDDGKIKTIATYLEFMLGCIRDIKTKSLCGVAVLLVTCVAAQAHPSVGIVVDSRGNIFYTDTKQVWKIAPDGTKTIAVANVHTHELCLDAEDNLYGEHLWYEGDATKKWGHRVWRLKRDGTLTEVFPTREGFLRDYSFVRDRAGNMYWSDPGARTVIKKRSPYGKIATYSTADFRDVGRMTATLDGELYLIDQGDLRRIGKDGKASTAAAKLSEWTPSPAKASERHYQMGLWADSEGGVYVAVAGEGLVLKVGSDGKRTVVARSSGGWAPSGVTRDRNGNLWILEYSPKNDVRVRRIDRNGGEQIFS